MIPARSASAFPSLDTFPRRHIGPGAAEREQMLKVIGRSSVADLIDATVPAAIRSTEPLSIQNNRGEAEVLEEFRAKMDRNEIYASFIGAGYYGTKTPAVLLRNMVENPGWYTPYTPYQAEISQGRLEMLLNYQTMVTDLTGLQVANASLLDEGTAAAEAMNMSYGLSKKKTAKTFLVSDQCHPQTIAVLQTRAKGTGLNIEVQPFSEFDASRKDVFGMIIQYPATNGSISDYRALCDQAHEAGSFVVAATDLLALTCLTPPGEWGADIALGSAQRFGVPLGYGGPHAAFFAGAEAHKRKMPGRIIGVSVDSRGKPAIRMAMQTREQHIRRDKATSNICTAQALLANLSAAYAIYHGPKGLRAIGEQVHKAAKTFAAGVQKLGFKVNYDAFFDTVEIHVPQGSEYPASEISLAARKAKINVLLVDKETIRVSFDEVNSTAASIEDLLEVFSGVDLDLCAETLAEEVDAAVDPRFRRTSEYLTHPVFNMYHCETEMMRYLFSLQSKDLSLQTAMIPLGSCTMKLNAASEMIPITWSTVNNIHPFAPKEQARGYSEMLAELRDDLAEITGFHTVSLQPNAGSQGEYAGLMAIREYHLANGDDNRNVCLIPVSAHGTNPASAAMSSMKVVVVKCDVDGNIDFADLKEKTEKHSANLSCLMITYPSTHGVFEDNVKEVCQLIHDHGGQVYMDGANMNAQVGLCSPGAIGADVCHLNLHKTFCIPHGGGGPGMGPIGVGKHLAPFMPNHPIIKTGGAQSMGAIASAPYSSASILPITWMYIRMMGGAGLTDATEMAIFNANYMAARLRGSFDVLYTGKNGTVAHEFIMDIRPLTKLTGITEKDVAKRLMDYNFHAPTMSWPVSGTLMVEPTESESLYELDRFCDAMLSIRAEIQEIQDGKADPKDNVLTNSPHTADTVISDTWTKPYSREKAAYPLSYLRMNKFWPSVSRLDDVYGDRNLICTCPPLSSYEEDN